MTYFFVHLYSQHWTEDPHGSCPPPEVLGCIAELGTALPAVASTTLLQSQLFKYISHHCGSLPLTIYEQWLEQWWMQNPIAACKLDGSKAIVRRFSVKSHIISSRHAVSNFQSSLHICIRKVIQTTQRSCSEPTKNSVLLSLSINRKSVLYSTCLLKQEGASKDSCYYWHSCFNT